MLFSALIGVFNSFAMILSHHLCASPIQAPLEPRYSVPHQCAAAAPATVRWARRLRRWGAGEHHDAWHDDPVREEGEQGGDDGGRTGVTGLHGRQAQCEEGEKPLREAEREIRGGRRGRTGAFAEAGLEGRWLECSHKGMNPCQVRRIGDDIIAGFAGSTADCFTLMERLERKLEVRPAFVTCPDASSGRDTLGRWPSAGVEPLLPHSQVPSHLPSLPLTRGFPPSSRPGSGLGCVAGAPGSADEGVCGPGQGVEDRQVPQEARGASEREREQRF